ncbi:MAG TPA: aminotransferase class III-fold pyridoxal phosphate-dependent enzyme, partial [Lysobacter sp.]
PAVAVARTVLENVMPQPAMSAASVADTTAVDRRPRLIAQLKDLFEDVAGFDMADAEADANFMELGLDSLMLTQVALQLEKAFGVKVSFRQLMGECASLGRLAGMIDAQLPPEVAVPAPAAMPPSPSLAIAAPVAAQGVPVMAGDGDFARQVIAQQMQLMAQQLALLSGNVAVASAPLQQAAVAQAPVAQAMAPAAPSPSVETPVQPSTQATASDEEAALAHTKYDVKKAFGAIARIDNHATIELSERQRARLDDFIARYVSRTRKSKEYTQAHRGHMADPRVVNGFRPLTKEIVYQIVIERSRGSHMIDLDGNDYVDALNGFGMSLFGWQPEFVLDAIRAQLELGYEIGPQHPLAGEVAKLVCEVTGHDRAALCNTGSEAVLGALRIARTVTGRNTVVLFTGSYHGIIDEMIVRGTKKLRAVPAAPGILRNTAENVLVLDYGTEESMQIIRDRASDIAAVLVEPVQSRRPDFQPREFLRELRQVTADAGALLVFDEVVTGFRAHPAGAQGLFGIQADLATYGKVVGGGYPIGVIAGKRDYMDALDGGHWQFGDDSVPIVGVTYFAGTFVRHPLALAAAHAVLLHIKEHGATLQQSLNARATAMVEELNAFCADRGAPIEVRHFASVWKTFFLEDHPLQDLLFAMMRSRGVHILDNFPCFLTTAHSDADMQRIISAFKESVIELQEAEFLPRHSATPHTVMDAERPAVAGARLGRDPDGRPAWFVPNPEQPGKYLKVGG